mgnify:CR=1 FL=1
MNLYSIKKKLSDFVRSTWGKRLMKWGQRILLVVVIGWLVYELTKIGWLNVWKSLPTSPTFYLLFVFLYLSLPLFEVFIYRITWSYNVVKAFPIFLLKKIYNKDLLGYSGEVYFFLWARKFLGLKNSQVLKTIKDNNIISSIASTLVSLGLLAAFFFTGQIKIVEWLGNQNQIYVIGGALLIVIITALFIRFRHYVISMPMKTAFSIFGIQIFRLLLGQSINLLMYIVVIPSTPFYVWFTLLSVEIILSRIPVLPNRDLIFTGAGISLSSQLQVPETELAALLVVKSVLNKVGNFAIFGVVTLLRKSEAVPMPNPDQETITYEAEDLTQATESTK